MLWIRFSWSTRDFTALSNDSGGTDVALLDIVDDAESKFFDASPEESNPQILKA